jgi:hypothetical protein
MSRFVASDEDSIVILESITDSEESAKVLPPLEKALMDVIIEWND